MAVAAAEHAVVGDRLRDACGQHQRGTGRHAVDDQQVALAGGHQDHAHHHRDLKAAKGGQHLDGLGHVLVAHLRATQHRHQVGQIVGFHVRAGDDEVAHRAVRQARQHQRRALVRAHAHARQHRDIALELVADLHAGAHAGMGLVQAHGRRGAAVARAMRDLAHHQALVRRHVLRHAAVHHRHFQLLGSRKHGQRQLVAQQHVHGVVGGAELRIDNAVHRQAVVGGENQQLRVVQPRLERVLHQAQADGQGFQFAQAAATLVAAMQLFAQGFFEQRAGGRRDQGTAVGHR